MLDVEVRTDYDKTRKTLPYPPDAPVTSASRPEISLSIDGMLLTACKADRSISAVRTDRLDFERDIDNT
jgi:hypothetical protein